MGIHSLHRSFFLSVLMFAVSLCSAEDNKFEVVGTTLCADCTHKTSLPFSGLHVNVECKLKNGEIKRVGWGNLDDQGKFQVSVPEEVVEDGQKLKQECYAQLQSAAAVPCATVHAADIVIKSRSNGLTTFTPTQNLHISSAFCTSKSFSPYFNYPPHPWFHHPKPPVPVIKPKPKPPVPVYKPKPKPKPPVYKPKPKPPVVKPVHPPVPIYKPKPKPPVYKPKPKPPVVKPVHPPVPIYKPKPKPPVYKPKPKPPVVKPVHPPVPIYKPKPKPPVPVYKPPVILPIPKKPCPPLPKLPPTPPKYFHHPIFGHFPPLPPSIPHYP